MLQVGPPLPFLILPRRRTMREEVKAHCVKAMGPNRQAMIGQRLISEEPMYILINLGISENFGAVK